MKKLILGVLAIAAIAALVLTFGRLEVATAADTGAVFPTAGATGGESSSVVWTNPGNITANDGAYATAGNGTSSLKGGCGVGCLSTNTTASLRATGFGFAIPSTATINGVVEVYERKSSVASSVNGGTSILLSAGASIGTQKTDASVWSTSDEVITRGSSSDLWGATLTPAIVNDSSFGVKQFANNTGGTVGVANIDYITVRVYYTDNGTPASVTSDAVIFE